MKSVGGLADLDLVLLDLAHALTARAHSANSRLLQRSDHLLLGGRPLLGPHAPVYGAALPYADRRVVLVVDGAIASESAAAA